jgi:hypothetical protein
MKKPQISAASTPAGAGVDAGMSAGGFSRSHEVLLDAYSRIECHGDQADTPGREALPFERRTP